MSRPALDLTLYLVTDPDLAPPETWPHVVREAVRGGVTLVQLRHKRATEDELVRHALALRAVLDPLGVPLIVNDHPHAARRAGAAGAHVGQSDADPRRARDVLGPDAVLGLSITRADQLAAVDPAIVDHLGVGPVFATATKADHDAPLGLEGLSAIGGAASLPCVAIGGLSARNAAAVARTNVAGLAVVSAILAARDPRAAAEGLRAAIARGRTEAAA